MHLQAYNTSQSLEYEGHQYRRLELGRHPSDPSPHITWLRYSPLREGRVPVDPAYTVHLEQRYQAQRLEDAAKTFESDTTATTTLTR